MSIWCVRTRAAAVPVTISRTGKCSAGTRRTRRLLSRFVPRGPGSPQVAIRRGASAASRRYRIFHRLVWTIWFMAVSLERKWRSDPDRKSGIRLGFSGKSKIDWKMKTGSWSIRIGFSIAIMIAIEKEKSDPDWKITITIRFFRKNQRSIVKS